MASEGIEEMEMMTRTDKSEKMEGMEERDGGIREDGRGVGIWGKIKNKMTFAQW